MATIAKFICEKCHYTHKVDLKYVGKKIKCPQCQNIGKIVATYDTNIVNKLENKPDNQIALTEVENLCPAIINNDRNDKNENKNENENVENNEDKSENDENNDEYDAKYDNFENIKYKVEKKSTTDKIVENISGGINKIGDMATDVKDKVNKFAEDSKDKIVGNITGGINKIGDVATDVKDKVNKFAEDSKEKIVGNITGGINKIGDVATDVKDKVNKFAEDSKEKIVGNITGGINKIGDVATDVKDKIVNNLTENVSNSFGKFKKLFFKNSKN